MLEMATLRTETRAVLCLSCGKCSTMCPLSPAGWFSAARVVAIREPETMSAACVGWRRLVRGDPALTESCSNRRPA